MDDLISRQEVLSLPRSTIRNFRGEVVEELIDVADIERLSSVQSEFDEWCTDCKEYDSERHCCPRYNRVIREAVKEAKKERINCAHCKRYDRHGHRCKWWNHGVSNVDWCSYAERKEEHE